MNKNKNIIRVAGIICATFLFTTVGFAHQIDSVLVKGIITIDEKEGNEQLNDAFVRIYKSNTVVNIIKTDKRGIFSTFIPVDTYIVIEFLKENYVTKRIIFDTRYKGTLKKIKPFDLEIVLLKEEKGIDYSELDFPITLVQYDKDVKDFVYNGSYTEQMLAIQQDIIDIKNKK